MVGLKAFGSITYAILHCTSALAATAFQCPAKDIKKTKCAGPTDCRYPAPGACNKFIHCTLNADGKTATPSTQTCPSGLLWRDNLKFCDYPDLSTCSNALQKTLAKTTGKLPPLGGIPTTDFDCKGQCAEVVLGLDLGNCVFPADDSDTEYIQCVDSLAFVVQCPSGKTFSGAVQACDIPDS